MSDDGEWGLRPLAGGLSGETFLSRGVDGADVVLRIYGGRSLSRGPLAPEVDAAVLELVRDLLPVPRVLEVRRGDPASDLPGLLVTELVPGVALAGLLPHLDEAGQQHVGTQLGTVVARLGHVVQPSAGFFVDRSLVAAPVPPELADLESVLAHQAPRLREVLGGDVVAALEPVVARAQDLLDEHPRRCLVHGDLDVANVLVDPVTLEVTALVDWELVHVGSAYSDLGRLLRHEHDASAFARAVREAHRAGLPDRARGPREGAVDGTAAVARAADLGALLLLAAQPDPGAEAHPGVEAARRVLARAALGGPPGATAGPATQER